MATITAATAILNPTTVKFQSRKVEMVDYTGCTTTVRRVDAQTITVNGETRTAAEGTTAIDEARQALREVAFASRKAQAANIVEFARTAQTPVLPMLLAEVEAAQANVTRTVAAIDEATTDREKDSAYRIAERYQEHAHIVARTFINVVTELTGATQRVPEGEVLQAV